METIKLDGLSVEFELPDGKKFRLPMPTAMHDIDGLAKEGVRKAQAETEKIQDEADKAGVDKPPEVRYTDREWYADIIEYIRKATANNGTPEGVELTEAQAAQISQVLPLKEAEAKKKLLAQLAGMQT